MVKNPPGNAKDISCSLGPGRSHMLQSDVCISVLSVVPYCLIYSSFIVNLKVR